MVRKKQSRGAAFRASVAKQFELPAAGPVWSKLLDEVCLQLDLIEDLEDRIEVDGILLDGLHQKVLHPGVAEVRAQRLVLAKLLRELGLDQAEGGSSRSNRQIANANRRRL